ncbi:MAG: hypothetical protein NTW72_06460 [Gemmatimonadetes bacterium]|nr:hypothetical protein [Gemmatimonadota bacterium]
MPQRQAVIAAREVAKEDATVSARVGAEISETAVALHRPVQIQQAVLHESEGHHGGDWLGNRRDIAGGLRSNRGATLHVGDTESACQDDRRIPQQHGGETGNAQRVTEFIKPREQRLCRCGIVRVGRARRHDRAWMRTRHARADRECRDNNPTDRSHGATYGRSEVLVTPLCDGRFVRRR